MNSNNAAPPPETHREVCLEADQRWVDQSGGSDPVGVGAELERHRQSWRNPGPGLLFSHPVPPASATQLLPQQPPGCPHCLRVPPQLHQEVGGQVRLLHSPPPTLVSNLISATWPGVFLSCLTLQKVETSTLQGYSKFPRNIYIKKKKTNWETWHYFK